jgi:hypothetical protein
MRIKQLLESATAGGTSTASVATVTKGSKGMIKRQNPTDNALDSGKLFQETNAAEGKDDKIAQLKADHATAVHWSKNETSPQKREAARQKAEKIKAHLEKQYKQGVAEGSGGNKTHLAMAYLKAVVMAPTGTPENERIRNWQEELADEFDIEMDTATLAQMLPQFDSMLQAGKLDKLQNRMASRGELYIESAEQGVAEGFGKNIKRAAQGWSKDGVTPQGIKKRSGEYSDDELKGLAGGYDELRRVRATTIMPTEVPKHSPAGLQKRVVDREMKKRGLGEQGVAEGDAKFDTMMGNIAKPSAVKALGREEKVHELIRKYFWHKRRADLGSAVTGEHGHDRMVQKVLMALKKMNVDLSTMDPSKLKAIKGEVYEQGVAEGDRPFRGVGGAFNRGDDERHDLDPTDWYVVKDGKMFKTSVYPNQVQLAIARGYSRTRDEAKAKAGKQGVEEGGASMPGDQYLSIPADQTKLSIGQKMARDGITYSPDKEDELIGLMSQYMKKAGMSSKQIRYYLSYDEDFISDQLSDLPKQGVGEGFPKDPNAPKLVRDRKTGKQYDPNKEFEKKMNSPEVMAQMKRMAQKEGAAEDSVKENKKGVRAVKHTVKPRNFVAKNAVATTSGAGAHKDKKKAMKQGDVKHKGKEPAYESKLWAALDRRIIK